MNTPLKPPLSGLCYRCVACARTSEVWEAIPGHHPAYADAPEEWRFGWGQHFCPDHTSLLEAHREAVTQWVVERRTATGEGLREAAEVASAWEQEHPRPAAPWTNTP